MIQQKARDTIFARVLAAADQQFGRRLSAQKLSDLKRFIEAFYASSSPEDLSESTPKQLLAVAHSMWRLAAQRKPKTPLIRVFNPDPRKDGWRTPHTVIQMVNDDMPFLVDSVTGELSTNQGSRIHAMHHPVFLIDRDRRGKRRKTIGALEGKTADGEALRESYIYAEIDAISDQRVLNRLETEFFEILSQVRAAVEDWRPMLAKADEAIANLEARAARTNGKAFKEARAFMEWLKADNFTFLGSRDYCFKPDAADLDVRQVKDSGLGILRDPDRHVIRGPKGLMEGAPEIMEFLRRGEPLLITKANAKAHIHRPVHMDYVGVKLYDEKGKPVGERQFVGLFTSQSYMKSPREVPLLRKKVEWVQKHAPFSRGSHAGKTITHILETFPRDELFLIGKERLFETATGILHLLERPRPKAFLRQDKFERYVSAIVYVPRESYHSGLREKIERILCKAFHGEISRYYALLSEDVLARWHFIIRTTPGKRPQVSAEEINAQIREASKPWAEGLRDELAEKYGEERGLELFEKYHRIFSVAYKEAFKPKQAIWDIENLENFDPLQEASFEIYREKDDPDHVFHLKIYHASRLIALSECLPMLENLGLKVLGENAYELLGEQRGYVHAFLLETRNELPINVEKAEGLIEPLLTQVWGGEVENDSFNALSIYAGISGENIVVLRAYAKYLRQIGLSFSQNYIESCLMANARIARRLVKLFHKMFEPGKAGLEQRKEKAEALAREIRGQLNRVSSLDQDRILRAYLHAILATQRTNFFTRDYSAARRPKGNSENGQPEPALALKIRSGLVPEAPKPKPFAEIFVYSPRVEGVHLRGGPVARGGIRWSDRKEDFRAEVLHLMKAQQVKNAVIVPVGAKGGFFPKQLPGGDDRDAVMREGLACYRIFIRTLLSVTDNLKGNRAVHPKGVVSWDGADPYLVVAADKGTTTFSDHANEIAQAQGFWLGDAFASGGSNGYDHKKMGITARGAWVSVARHFRELGIDADKEAVSVIGIGDMAGDVFGNGMLLSKKIKLLAAFDHRHIFFDPRPSPEKSWRERKRLFGKPRSTWADYQPKLISKGGGVFDRSAKAVRLSRAMRDFLGVDAKELTPDEVIHHLLKAEADLLWIGGIGTFIKASAESHNDVSDRANDAVRVDASELRVKVVGEGANLGMTQKGRIEYARGGGRCNTDFIDNSAGVDCSDKEVNIKILLAAAEKAGKLITGERRKLLAGMTEEIAEIVLRNNYLQTQTISIAEFGSMQKREQHAGLIRVLEKEGRMERALEKLPTDEQFSKLALKGRGLVRPDLAVLVAYAKLRLKDLLMQSDVLEAPILRPELERGFPKRLARRFSKQLEGHQLRRELIATSLANELVNRAGLTFVTEIEEETGLSVDQIFSAYLVTREAFSLKEVWRKIDALDHKIPAQLQIQLHQEAISFLHSQTTWFLKHLKRPIKSEEGIKRYQEGLAKIIRKPERVLGPLELGAFTEKSESYIDAGVPCALARKVAAFTVLGQVCDIVNVALSLKRKEEDVGVAYFEVGRVLGFDWLRNTALSLIGEDHWDYLAASAINDDLGDQQRELTRSILERNKKLNGVAAVKHWVKTHPRALRRARKLVNDLKASGAITVAKLSFAVRHFRSIVPRKV